MQRYLFEMLAGEGGGEGADGGGVETAGRPALSLADARDYQFGWRDAVRAGWLAGRKRLCGVAATGTGKGWGIALFAQDVLDGVLGGYGRQNRPLVIAHRKILVEQLAGTLTDLFPDKAVEIEMGDQRARGDADIVVACLDSLATPRRLRYFKPDRYAAAVWDEAHRYGRHDQRVKRVLRHFGEAMCHVGLTATPDRADGEMEFDDLAFEYDIFSAVDDGYLVRPYIAEGFGGDIELDRVKVTGGGEFDAADLSDLMSSARPLAAAVGAARYWSGYKGGRRAGIVTCASVDHAELAATLLNEWDRKEGSGKAAAVHSDMSTAEIDDVLGGFRRGEILYLTHFDCLDEETEVLTADGWKGIDEATTADEVANWRDGRVWFSKPLAVVSRDRRGDERMVELNTPRRSVRVTEGHRMLFRTGDHFRHALGRDVVGRAGELPVSGLADPLPVRPDQPDWPPVNPRQVTANAYTVRKSNPAMTHEESRAEAVRRLEARNGLRHKNPDDLTSEECELIGFWVGDGSRTELKSGGVQYTLCQSAACPSIIRRVDHLIRACGLDVVRKVRWTDKGEYVIWSLARGTGFGPQSRHGVFHLEPYLRKGGTKLLWGFTRDQFSSFLRGLWMADGVPHNDRTEPPAGGGQVCGINRDLFDLIQAVGTCRGYRVTVRERVNRGKPILLLSFAVKSVHTMHNKPGLTFAFSTPRPGERVWCVTTESGNLVTRRRGTVTVMGNCLTEGFDSDLPKFLVNARPCKQRYVFGQQAGRVLRPAVGVARKLAKEPDAQARRQMILNSDKPGAVICDLAVTGHRLSVDLLDVFRPRDADDDWVDAVRRKAQQKAKGGKPADPLQDFDAMKEAWAAAKAARRDEARDRWRGVLVGTDVAYRFADPFVQAVTTGREPPWFTGKRPTPKMKAYLIRAGIPRAAVDQYTFFQAKRQCDVVSARREQGLCTFKQLQALRRAGVDGMHMSFEEASAELDRLAKTNWGKRP